jgi:hypothetical protein
MALKRLPGPIYHKAQHILSTECGKRRPPGLPANLKRVQEIQAEMNRLSTELRGLRGKVTAACTHPVNAIEYDSDDYDDTLGNHSHTRHTMRCTDCQKRWSIGDAYGYGNGTIIIDGQVVRGR